jgi:hypothetical protein
VIVQAGGNSLCGLFAVKRRRSEAPPACVRGTCDPTNERRSVSPGCIPLGAIAGMRLALCSVRAYSLLADVALEVISLVPAKA